MRFHSDSEHVVGRFVKRKLHLYVSHPGESSPRSSEKKLFLSELGQRKLDTFVSLSFAQSNSGVQSFFFFFSRKSPLFSYEKPLITCVGN